MSGTAPAHGPGAGCIGCPAWGGGRMRKLGLRVEGADHVVALAGP